MRTESARQLAAVAAYGGTAAGTSCMTARDRVQPLNHFYFLTEVVCVTSEAAWQLSAVAADVGRAAGTSSMTADPAQPLNSFSFQTEVTRMTSEAAWQLAAVVAPGRGTTGTKSILTDPAQRYFLFVWLQRPPDSWQLLVGKQLGPVAW
jgi:hypothetical protein